MKFLKSFGLGILAWFIALIIFANVNHDYSRLIEHILSACVGIAVFLALMIFVSDKKDVKEQEEEKITIDTDKDTIEEEGEQKKDEENRRSKEAIQ